MTSTEEAVADDPAVLPPDLSEAAATALREQPTFAALLDPSDTTWTEEGPGRYAVLVAPDVAGVLDAAAGRFVPDDPEQVRLLLAERMAATVGETPVAGGAGDRVVDWTTLRITDEAGGVLTATANTVADAADGDAVHAVQLSIDLALQPAVVTEQLVAGGAFEAALDEAIEVREAQAAEAEAAVAEEAPAVEAAPAVDAAYLGGYYGESAFPFDGNNFVFDWTTWTHDQTTPDGTVGFTAHVTATDGTTHDTYAWFDPAVGISIVRAEPLAGAEALAGAEEAAPAIDAAYLGGYYGTSSFPFDGNNFVFDWTTWTHDQTTPDGTVGFTARATATDGTTHDTYAWFDPAVGISIVRAEALAGAATPAADEPVADPRAEFESLTGQLRDRWRSAGNRLEELNGKAYDVHGWVEGEPGCELVHQSFDGECHLAELGAHTDGDARPVTVLLRIRDAETVWVDREDDRY
ncbi:hypothetical protein VA596_37225 [Amycolatopsis sp., V23-08]|uniref:DUF3471 domain-containing protein n=1 Tax=Amycolatopsis heterodermiae TaxID=3110235 RepID=A0ABU5RGC6_9PSEU|nr:hypothetical protein [Amycolatopsis sp., V23-08]MEA5365223.1 hypothetical protein [Amycolatopsis sp., V23-08]